MAAAKRKGGAAAGARPKKRAKGSPSEPEAAADAKPGPQEYSIPAPVSQVWWLGSAWHTAGRRRLRALRSNVVPGTEWCGGWGRGRGGWGDGDPAGV